MRLRVNGTSIGMKSWPTSWGAGGADFGVQRRGRGRAGRSGDGDRARHKRLPRRLDFCAGAVPGYPFHRTYDRGPRGGHWRADAVSRRANWWDADAGAAAPVAK